MKKKDALINQISDIEDLVTIGRDQNTCPFYLTRELQHKAEVLFMPYNYLVDSMIRQTLKIDLNNAILIFDEAHNLVCTRHCCWHFVDTCHVGNGVYGSSLERDYDRWSARLFERDWTRSESRVCTARLFRTSSAWNGWHWGRGAWHERQRPCGREWIHQAER